MKKIASFTIDHIKLQPGIYVSRKDYLGDQVITTFDIRMTSPVTVLGGVCQLNSRVI